MARAELKELENYPISVDLDVRVSDLNYGAHLGYDRLLGLAHQARLVLFDRLGVTELNLGEENTGVLVIDVIAVYLGEAFLRDRLTFELCPVDIRGSSFRLCHRITCHARNSRIALLEIGFTAFDYKRRKVVPFPQAFGRGLGALADRRAVPG